jgi:hypothetical protein
VPGQRQTGVGEQPVWREIGWLPAIEDGLRDVGQVTPRWRGVDSNFQFRAR